MGLDRDIHVRVTSPQCAGRSGLFGPGGRYRWFSKPFDLVPRDRLLTKLLASGVDSRVVVWVREFLVGRTQRATIQGNHNNLRCVTRERFGPTTVSSVRK